jgi:hypothetical protein
MSIHVNPSMTSHIHSNIQFAIYGWWQNALVSVQVLEDSAARSRMSSLLYGAKYVVDCMASETFKHLRPTFQLAS